MLLCLLAQLSCSFPCLASVRSIKNNASTVQKCPQLHWLSHLIYMLTVTMLVNNAKACSSCQERQTLISFILSVVRPV